MFRVEDEENGMKFGVSTFVWVSPCTTRSIEALAPKVRSMGFDILEIAVENPGLLDPGDKNHLHKNA
jgi:D-psicose/D-tagatose/L-ribulose 3-epimerase